MELFKYLKSEHFDALSNKGSIRIGTLKNYQSQEHGAMVSDSMEGSKRFTGNYETITADQLKGSRALSSLISIGEGISNLQMNNIVIIEPNYFVFSLSSGYSKSDHDKWLEQETYDTCYKLATPNHFFRKITKQINKIRHVKFLGLFEVHYYDEKNGMDFFDTKNAYPAFMLKDYDGFSTQKEIRAVWETIEKEEIEPIFIKDIKLRAYVNLHAKVQTGT